MPEDIQSLLKARTEALVKAVGVEAACAAAGRSKATIGRYYSTHPEHEKRFMPVDAVAALERVAGARHVSGLLYAVARDAAPEAAIGTRLDRTVAALEAQGDPALAADLAAVTARIEAMEARLQAAGPARVTTTDPTE